MCNIQWIRPKEMKFSYKLGERDCHAVATGQCSLELPFENDNCQILCQRFLKEGVLELVEIAKNACGHYSISYGQRRICISRKMDLRLQAIVGDKGEQRCDDCQ